MTDYTHSDLKHVTNVCRTNALDSDYAKDNAIMKMSAAEDVDGQSSQQLSVGTFTSTTTTASMYNNQQQQQHQTNPLVPIISVTPHSPGINNKHYHVLGNCPAFGVDISQTSSKSGRDFANYSVILGSSKLEIILPIGSAKCTRREQLVTCINPWNDGLQKSVEIRTTEHFTFKIMEK